MQLASRVWEHSVSYQQVPKFRILHRKRACLEEGAPGMKAYKCRTQEV